MISYLKAILLHINLSGSEKDYLTRGWFDKVPDKSGFNEILML